jgi:hypothetical protein
VVCRYGIVTIPAYQAVLLLVLLVYVLGLRHISICVAVITSPGNIPQKMNSSNKVFRVTDGFGLMDQCQKNSTSQDYFHVK